MKKLIDWIIRVKLLSPFFKRLIILSNYIERKWREDRKIEGRKGNYQNEVRYYQFTHDLKVKNGPFKGVVYPTFESFGSAILPKLLGSYEKELWKVLESFIKQEYVEILDIGCAEGYYATGLAKRMQIPVKAFDTESKARDMCIQMAKLNEVDSLVDVKGECSRSFLMSLNKDSRRLVICDCEGCELNLFQAEVIENLSNCDLIIECHDFLYLGLSIELYERFKKTHDVKFISSVDDIEKIYTYELREIKKLTLKQKKQVLSEHRPTIMKWLICERKN